jgi:hypothetical protein
MSSDMVRYLATGGAITLCASVAHVISLKMRLRFNRYVVDKAAEQGQDIDPVEIINAASALGTPYRLTRSPGGHVRNSPGSGTTGKRALAKPAASPALPPPAGGHPGLCSK